MAIIETTPFNFDELYRDLEAKFRDAGYDVYPGSNISQLITAMAYFTSMLNVNTAVNINETLLPYSTQRKNVLTVARVLGYEIQHKQSYVYKLTLTLSGSPDGTYVIPKYTEFVEGGKTYYYMGNQIEYNNQFNDTQVEIYVKEGKLFKYIDHPSTLSIETTTVQNESGALVPQYYIDIPFVDVEENGIECYVNYYDDYGNYVQNEEWVKADHLSIDKDFNPHKKFFRLDNIDSGTPRIYFKFGGIGSGLRVGTIVNFNILQTSGVNGAMTNPDNPSGIKHNLNNITVTKVDLVSQGTDEESIESIKINAPTFYNSANRAVTANDYRAICNRQTSVLDSFIWGGDEEFPKCPGHIWFSFLPSRYVKTYTSDIFNLNYKLDNDVFNTWDYSITDPKQYQAQIDAANASYSLRFLEDSEIKSTAVNNSGQLIQPGVWDVLDSYRIPTLTFHNRHPIYLDFDYIIEILKYDIVTSKASIHNDIFNIIRGFFEGKNDTFKLETFENEYFHSSLEKRIDAYLTDSSGYNNSVSTKLLLTLKNVSNENTIDGYRDIYIPLGVPYEPYFDNSGYLMYDVLPSIDTPNFIDYRKPDGTASSATFIDQNKVLSTNILDITGVSNIYENATFTITDDGTNITSVTSNYDLLDANGNLIAQAGTNLIDVSIQNQNPLPILGTTEIKLIGGGVIFVSTNPNPGTGGVAKFMTSGAAPATSPNTNLYTDWSDIQKEIDASTPQVSRSNIIAPIRISLTEVVNQGNIGDTSTTLTLRNIKIYPDDPTVLDIEGGVPTYNKTTVTKISGNVEIVLNYGANTNGWSLGANNSKIVLTEPLGAGEKIRVQTEAMCGMYNLFNSFKKYIIIQLYVDALGFGEMHGANTPIYDTPKSYLTTVDQLYVNTADLFYLTTEGYALKSPNQVSSITGPIVKTISPSLYISSPIKMELFRRDRYINLKYKSPNFKVIKNVIPRLNSVTFI